MSGIKYPSGPEANSPTSPSSVTLPAAQSGAFGRLRTALPYTLFDSKQIFDAQPQFWDDQEESGSGTSSTHDQNKAASTLAVTATTAGKRTRQTFMRFNYQPGKSQLIYMTGILCESGAGTGIVTHMGLGDDNNGLFLVSDEGVVKLRRRTKASGAAVDNDTNQASWDDPLDGTGPSGITIDWTKTQIIFFDFEWLGVGTVRFGVVVDGVLYICHSLHHANSLAVVYMSTPNLPLRYQIENLGTGGAAQMVHICSTVISEGGVQDLGTKHFNSVNSNAASANKDIQANTAGTVYAICGVRLKSAALGGTVNPLEVSLMNETSDDYEWGLSLNPTLANDLTWTNESNSVVQFGVGDTVNSPSNTTLTALGSVLDGGFVKSSSTAGAFAAVVKSARRLGAAIDGTPDELILWVRPLAANADMRGGLTWRELS